MNEFTRTIINGLKTYIQKSRGNWSQNDETAVDYIKNRTHWAEEGIIEILPKTTIEITEENNSWSEDNILPKMLVEGTEYTIIWNGVEYTCLARNGGYDYIYIGNQALGGRDFPEIIESSEPFFIVTYAPNNWSRVAANIGTHTARISYQDEVIHKIDKKYLPENIKNILDGKAGGSIRTIGAYDEIGEYAFAEGNETTASGWSSHTEGYATTASSDCAHAEGMSTTASGLYSHAEGQGTTSSGGMSHAEGVGTTASGNYSHAEGWFTTAASPYQHVQGKNNIADTENKYAHIVGNGATQGARSNAHTLDWNGNAWFQGDVYINSTSGKNKDEGSKKLATEEYVTQKVAEINIETPTEYESIILKSSVSGSTKKFRLTIDDDGVLSAEKVVS